MNGEKYIGLDVHQATISIAVLDTSGKLVMESVVETKATTLLEFLAGLRGSLHVTLEEGTCVRFTEAPRGSPGGLQSAQECSAKGRQQE